MKYVKTWCAMLLVAAATAGCSPASDTQPMKDAGTANDASGEEEHAPGPNGGVVFDLGQYHAEFTVDHEKKECYILVLGPEEKSPPPTSVDAKEFTLITKESKTKEGAVVPPMTIAMLPTDAADGKASKFVGTDPGLGNVADFEGTVLGEIGGKPAQGEFKEQG